MNAELERLNVASPVLIVENSDVTLPRLSDALCEAGIRNRVILLPDTQSAVQYLDGNGLYADRKRHPLPGLVLLDVTLPKIKNPEAPSWLTPPPVARQIVVTDLCGAVDAGQFESAAAFGPNAVVCKLSSSESLVSFFKELREVLNQGEKLSVLRAA